jgi:hypothetical protein
MKQLQTSHAHFLLIIGNDSHGECPREGMFWSKQQTSGLIQALFAHPVVNCYLSQPIANLFI